MTIVYRLDYGRGVLGEGLEGVDAVCPEVWVVTRQPEFE